jgi:hypothetical protein
MRQLFLVVAAGESDVGVGEIGDRGSARPVFDLMRWQKLTTGRHRWSKKQS